MADMLTSAIDGLAFAYVLLFFPAPIFWMIIHPGIRFWRRFGNRSFFVALGVWGVCGAALVHERHALFSQRLGRNPFTWMAGLALLGIVFWINRQVHHQFSLRRLAGFPELNPERHPGGVVRSGIYSRLRHPRYVEFMLSFLALGLLTGALGIFVLAIVTVLLYLIVAPLEEQELREHYGAEYDAYTREVPRFVPRLRRRNKLQTSS
jgi:protein-S-isoprenylcysteine O-methyltransferase Ste14